MKARATAGEEPRFVAPMQALGAVELPPDADEAWHAEIKFDGYRAIAVLRHGKVALWSRNEHPLSYPEIAAELRGLKCRSAVLDGEIVALDDQGRSSFQGLQGRELGRRPAIVYYVFDLLHLDGRSTLAQPIEARQRALRGLLAQAGGRLQLSPVFDAPPRELFAQAQRQGLEGIVLKRKGSVYEPERRSGAWLKLKRRNEQEFVLGGFTPPRGSREDFGAVLVGYYAANRLQYAGRVGTGFDRALLRSLRERFRALETARCPFANLPMPARGRFGAGLTRSAMALITWLRPQLVAQVGFAEWTQDGLLRQPVFLGLRRDKPAREVRREAAAVSPGAVRSPA